MNDDIRVQTRLTVHIDAPNIGIADQAAEQIRSRINEMTGHFGRANARVMVTSPVIITDPRELLLSESHLSHNTVSRLTVNGLRTIGDVLAKTPAELWAMPGMHTNLLNAVGNMLIGYDLLKEQDLPIQFSGLPFEVIDVLVDNGFTMARSLAWLMVEQMQDMGLSRQHRRDILGMLEEYGLSRRQLMQA